MNDNIQTIKMLLLNAASWTSSIATLQLANDTLHFVATVGSILVSGLSAWWIVKQARNLERLNKEKEKQPVQPK
jgi:ABC-type nickel/cobalt efflux system permease component RcnA